MLSMLRSVRCPAARKTLQPPPCRHLRCDTASADTPRRAAVQAAARVTESCRSRCHSRGVSSKTSRAGCVETRSMTSRR